MRRQRPTSSDPDGRYQPQQQQQQQRLSVDALSFLSRHPGFHSVRAVASAVCGSPSPTAVTTKAVRKALLACGASKVVFLCERVCAYDHRFESLRRLLISDRFCDAGLTLTLSPNLCYVVPSSHAGNFLAVQPSTLGRDAGYGLFVRGPLSIPAGTVLCEYSGEEMTTASLTPLMRTYAVYLSDVTSIVAVNADGQPTCIAALANDARGAHPPNAEITFFVPHLSLLSDGRRRLFLRALRDLVPGEEVFVCYGDPFWMELARRPLRLSARISLRSEHRLDIVRRLLSESCTQEQMDHPDDDAGVLPVNEFTTLVVDSAVADGLSGANTAAKKQQRWRFCEHRARFFAMRETRFSHLPPAETDVSADGEDVDVALTDMGVLRHFFTGIE